jgi:trigger factor
MTIEASRLRIDLQERERWRRTLNVTVPAELVREEREQVASKLAKRIKLPGFRSGKIPASVVEKRFGPALHQEMLNRVIEQAYREALRVESLNPISEGEVEKVQYEPEQDLSFTISFDVRPVIELGRLGGFQVQRPRVTAGEEDLARVLERLRRQGGAWRPVDSGQPQRGDRVGVTVARLDEGVESQQRSYDLVLGEGDALAEVEEAIASLEPGMTGEFDIPIRDDAGGDQTQSLRITLRDRRVLDLPDLDDAFARSLGDFEDVAALQARVRDDLEREAAQQAEAGLRARLLDQVVDANPFEVPRSMVDRYVDSVIGETKGVDPERLAALKEQLRPEAEAAVRRALVLERVADQQGLRPTEAELDQRIEELASRSSSSPAEVYARLQKSGRLEAMEREITEQKVFDFLKEKSRIEDEV